MLTLVAAVAFGGLATTHDEKGPVAREVISEKDIAEKLDGKETSTTETFVALKAEVRAWRWANVPFYLRTGKRLPQKVSEIVIQYRALPFSICLKPTRL